VPKEEIIMTGALWGLEKLLWGKPLRHEFRNSKSTSAIRTLL
jgi:hypothetical protein